MTKSELFDPDATRMAAVNPLTGVEIEIPMLEDKKGGEDAEATVLGKVKMVDPSRKRGKTVEIKPPEGMRATGEMTVLWSEKRDVKAEVIAGIKGVWQNKNRRLFLLGLVGTLAVMAAALGLGKMFFGSSSEQSTQIASVREKTTSARERNNINISEMDEIHRPSVVDGAVPQKTNSTEATENLKTTSLSRSPQYLVSDGELVPPTLKRATDALVDGRLTDALEIYERLKQIYPDEKLFQVASKILRQQSERRSK